MSGRPISILYFSNELVRGGAEEHILTLVRGLDPNAFRIHLACPPELAEQLRSDLPRDVNPVPLSLRKPKQFGAALRLAQLLREYRVDILHSHLFYSSAFASPIGWLCGVPVILETPHVREQWRKGWLKSRYVVDRAVGRFVDYYVAVSHANARYLVEQKGLPSKKIKVIHNGCDVRRFDPSYRPPASLKQSLGFGPGDPVLLVLGRLEPQKGHRVLLQALPRVLRQFPRTRLVCLGEGSLRRDLEGLARDLGLDGTVRFLGFQSNVPDWLALAEMTILPSLYEGLPLVAVESLAAGRAVVATAVDGTPEVVIDGKTGLTVPPGDGDQLAEAICRLLRDGELRRQLGHAGRRWVLEHFSQERQVQQTQALYLWAWEQHVRGAETRTPAAAIGNPGDRRATPVGG
jgi:glycosyltransferase involved in cell wall biosynthesis